MNKDSPTHMDPGKGADVERVNQYSFYELGQTLQSLRTITADAKLSVDYAISCMSAQTKLSELKSGKPIPVHVCSQALDELLEAIEYFLNLHFYKADEKGENKFQFPSETDIVQQWPLNRLVNSLNTFQTVFSAEIREVSSYFVPERGIYSTPGLVDRADDSFPTELRDKLSDKTRIDWRAAGRCLAFNLLTASGFHACRAVEGTLEKYYQHFSGKNQELKSWFDYIDALRTLAAMPGAAGAPSDKVISELDQMKDDYRNPVMHPRVVLREEDARILFDNSESLIIAMLQEIYPPAKAKP